MEEIKPEPADTMSSRAGPGEQLRQARQDLRLAPEDVAQMLHLSPKQIIALETDDYQHLPGPTYVRGYLRSYAQLLGLAPEKIIEVYNNLTASSKPTISLPPSAPPPQVTSSDRTIKIATWGLAGVVLSLVYLWWQSQETEQAPVSLSSPGILGQAAEENPADAEEAPTPGASPPSSAEPAPLLGAEPGLNQPLSNTPVLPPAEASKPANTAPAASPPAAGMVTQTRRATGIPPGAPRARMVLHAMEESWADIRDARDNKLLYENVPAGRRISIEGAAPFSVFLGNADGVRVEFNGQNYDISRHKRGQVARFTLGGETAANN